MQLCIKPIDTRQGHFFKQFVSEGFTSHHNNILWGQFPIDNQTINWHSILDTCLDLQCSVKHLFYFTVERLGALFPQLRLKEDKMREEFTDYQVTDSKQLPQEERIDRFWGLVGKDMRFSELPKLMKALLCIPHSNASSERVFSMVRKIVTENRMTLDNRTVCALLSCKINHSGPAHKYTPSKTVLKNAKNTNLYNNSLKE
ncbi:hypothetical protein PO909_032694 [Leuciscus waleckii]